MVFLHQVPFVADALVLGFLPGFREDCGYQADQYLNLEIPVGMLDNDFRNPDLERFVDRFFEYEPQVGVIGDVYERDDVEQAASGVPEIATMFAITDIESFVSRVNYDSAVIQQRNRM